MPSTSFFIAGDRAALVANDVSDPRYRAAVHYIPSGVQVPMRTHDSAETVFFLEDGLLEFMVGGPAAMVSAGAFVRVPPGVPFAYRNAGGQTARLLVRLQRPAASMPVHRITLEYSADHAA